MAYIDKARVIGVLNRFKKEHSNLPSACLKMIDIALNIIKQIPTVDVVEVVRCGKCKHWMYIGQGLDAVRIGKCCNDNFPFHCEQRPIMKEDDFCSYGEKKDKV